MVCTAWSKKPCLKVTVPVAAALMPDSAKVAWAPKVMVAEVEPLTVVEKVVGVGSEPSPGFDPLGPSRSAR